MGKPHPFNSAAEIGSQYDVAIDIAKDVVLGNLLGAVKVIIDPLESGFISFHIRFVAHAELMTDFCSALIIAEQNHFDIWMKKLPALQSIVLDDTNMTVERLGSSEDCDHLITFVNISASSFKFFAVTSLTD